ELKRQINVGLLPEPERIYVPSSSGATAAGLALGCSLAGVGATVVAVADSSGGRRRPGRIAGAAARFPPRRARPIAPDALRPGAIQARSDLGPTSEAGRIAAHRAAALARDLEGLTLDPSFGAAAMAALVDDAREGRVHGPALFWHTHPEESLAGRA